ncbi:hypothetical protein F4860DRAFT_517908 [Xylaria cubensis]|nr:hypothetical protein F4860DRAFT_517908 [Xylaria cubensis]
MKNAFVLAILALCQQNKTTITCLLNGLAFIAFSTHLNSTDGRSGFSKLHRHGPPAGIYLRPHQTLRGFDTELVARIHSKLPADATEERDLSADLRRELWAVSAQNWLEIVHKLEGGLRNDVVGVPMMARGISRAYFGLSAEIPAAAIDCAPVSVASWGMCVSANWPDYAVDTMLGERIMADIEWWLA